mgnify:CR=1 FL=1
MTHNHLLDFEAFWNYSTERANAYNDLFYHPCCDVWTTRNSKRARNSHQQQTRWRALLTSLDPRQPDKKTALKAKMIEEGWSIPVVLNDICRAHLSRKPVHFASAFKHHTSNPLEPPSLTIATPKPVLHPPQTLPPLLTPMPEEKEASNSIMDEVSLKSFSLPGRSAGSLDE